LPVSLSISALTHTTSLVFSFYTPSYFTKITSQIGGYRGF
jgi:hypothetical protein